MKKKTQYKIYVLKHPVTMEVRYVGITCQPLYQRLSNHLYYAKQRNCTHVHNWILSLLKENLKPIIETIELVSKSKWEKREKFWIKKYRLQTNLTNIDDGGRGLVKSRSLTSRQRSALAHQRAILQINLKGEIISEFDSINSAYKSTGISRTSIGNVLAKRSKTAGKYYWAYKTDFNTESLTDSCKNNSLRGYSKMILRENIETKEKRLYNSIEEACEHNNILRHMLLNIIRSERPICGYLFSWKVEDIV